MTESAVRRTDSLNLVSLQGLHTVLRTFKSKAERLTSGLKRTFSHFEGERNVNCRAGVLKQVR